MSINIFKDIKYESIWLMSIPWRYTHGYTLSEVHQSFRNIEHFRVGNQRSCELTSFNRFFLLSRVDYLKPFLKSRNIWSSYEKRF